MSLNFLNKLNSLQQELNILLDYADSPEECSALGPDVLTVFSEDLTFLVNQLVRYLLICQNMEIKSGEGEDAESTTGIEVVKALMVESTLNLVQKLLLDKSGNMEFTRDLFNGLHMRQKIQDSTETLPSQNEKLLGVINTVSRMEQQYLADQEAAKKAELSSEAPEEVPAEEVTASEDGEE